MAEGSDRWDFGGGAGGDSRAAEGRVREESGRAVDGKKGKIMAIVIKGLLGLITRFHDTNPTR